MKKWFWHILSVSISFSGVALASQGAVDGGGGKAVVCRNDSGEITSAEVLDLYEGRVQFGLPLLIGDKPYMEQAIEVLEKITTGRGQDFRERQIDFAKFINEIKRVLPEGTRLLDVDDSHHVIADKQCNVEQVANFINPNHILFDGEIWNALNETNRAALIVHETIYREFRLYGAENSIRARKAVAVGFLGIDAIDVKEGVPDDHVQCHTAFHEGITPFPGTHFWAYNDEDGQLIFQFDYLDGGLMLSKSTVMLDKIPVNKLLPISDLAPIDFTSYWLSITSLFEMGAELAVVLDPKIIDVQGAEVPNFRIGFGGMPNVPEQVFICYRPKDAN